MYLGNPLLPINFTVSSVGDSIKKKLTAKDWGEYEQKPIKLFLLPYFLYNYHYFVENSGDGKSTIKSSVHGVLAIDGHSIEIDEGIVELLKHNWKKSSAEIPRGEFEEKYNNIGKREQDEVIQMKTAEHFEVPKQNVVISSARQMLVPFYRTSLVLEGKEYFLTINAIDGSIKGIKEIPDREKGYMELTRETINELKSPATWIKYSKEAIVESFSAVKGEKKSHKNKPSGDGVDLSFLDSKLLLILIMLLGLLLIFMGIFRIKPV